MLGHIGTDQTVAGTEGVIFQGRVRGKLDHLLADKQMRIGLNLRFQPRLLLVIQPPPEPDS